MDNTLKALLNRYNRIHVEYKNAITREERAQVESESLSRKLDVVIEALDRKEPNWRKAD